MRYVKFADAEFFCEQVKCDIFFEIKRNISCDFFGESGNGNGLFVGQIYFFINFEKISIVQATCSVKSVQLRSSLKASFTELSMSVITGLSGCTSKKF